MLSIFQNSWAKRVPLRRMSSRQLPAEPELLTMFLVWISYDVPACAYCTVLLPEATPLRNQFHVNVSAFLMVRAWNQAWISAGYLTCVLLGGFSSTVAWSSGISVMPLL